MQPITQEYLINHTPSLTIEHIKKGASGYAEYALEGPLKGRIACVDYSRIGRGILLRIRRWQS